MAVPYDEKPSDYPGYFDGDGNFVQTEDDSGPEWYRIAHVQSMPYPDASERSCPVPRRVRP